jgi:NitT/TauT family transport system substrate-binding protein
MKKILSLILVCLLLLGLCACAEETPATANQTPATAQDNTTVRLIALQGPTGMGLASLIHNDTVGSGNKADYEVKLVTSAEIQNISAAIVKGECDIAAVPINLSSTLYNNTDGQVQVIAANTLGVLHLLENGNTIQSVADLRGKTVYATGKGNTPEYILRYVLKENGIDPDKDLTITFVADHTELSSRMALDLKNGVYSIGMLPEPNVSAVLTANADFRVALNMTEEWNKVAGSDNTLIQGVFVARKAFIEAHPKAVENFLDDYNASQTLVNSDKDQGAKLIVEAGIIPKEPIAKKAIPGCNITFLEGEPMKNGVKKCLQVLLEANPKSVGGNLPEDDFYYAR